MSQETIDLMILINKINHMDVIRRMREGLGFAGSIGHPYKHRAIPFLRLISENDGMTNAEISEKLDIKPSSVSNKVSSLEEDGLIKRVQSDDDKRVATVHLTEKGEQTLKDYAEGRNQISEEVFGELSESEQKELISIFEKLLNDWETKKFDVFDDRIDGFGPMGPTHRILKVDDVDF